MSEMRHMTHAPIALIMQGTSFSSGIALPTAYPHSMPRAKESHPPEERRALAIRLRKVTGQLRAVESMLAEDYDCPEVLTQLVSARRALKALSEKLIHSHVETCIAGAVSPAEGRRKLRDLLSVLERYVE